MYIYASMTDDQKIEKIKGSLLNLAFSDIKAVNNLNRPIAGFMLCYCFVDQLAHIRYFNLKSTNKNRISKPATNAELFTKFVDDYLNIYGVTKYNSTHLWEDLRNKLIHNYSIGKTYKLVDGHLKGMILKHNILKQKEKYLFLSDFISDIEKAFSQLVNEMSTDPNVRQIAIWWYNKNNIISQISSSLKEK